MKFCKLLTLNLFLMMVPAGLCVAKDNSSISVNASSWEQKAHGGKRDYPPQLSIDGKLDGKSSWRAEGEGQWIEYNLGKKLNLSAVKLTFFKSNNRQYTIEIKVSETGKEGEWTTVLGKQQTAQKAGWQSFSFASIKTQHVKVVGYGNTNKKYGKWINIIEADFVAD